MNKLGICGIVSAVAVVSFYAFGRNMTRPANLTLTSDLIEEVSEHDALNRRQAFIYDLVRVQEKGFKCVSKIEGNIDTVSCSQGALFESKLTHVFGKTHIKSGIYAGRPMIKGSEIRIEIRAKNDVLEEYINWAFYDAFTESGYYTK
jgi:hypothetical protein